MKGVDMYDLKTKDFEILNALHTYRKLTSEMLCEVTSFQRPNRCRESLKKLTDYRFVSRVSWHGLHTTAGRAYYVYSLAQRGMNTLTEAWGLPRKRIRKVRGKSAHNAHILAINSFRICLEHACRDHPEIQLAGLITEYNAGENPDRSFGRITAVKTAGPPGASRVYEFIPDLVFSLERHGAKALFCVEIDLGTEPKTLLKNKVIAYDRLYEARGYEMFNTVFNALFTGFRLLFVGSPDRFTSLVKSLEADGMDTDFLWGFDIDQLDTVSLFDKVWLVGGQPYDTHDSIIGEV